MNNPYWGKDFFGFFATLYHRLMGGLPLPSLASDEIQLLVLCAVAASCVLVGTFLTLKRITMLANSISHTILLGIIGAHLLTLSSAWLVPHLSTFFLAAFLTALLTVFFTQFLTDTMNLQEDASIGLVFTSLFALGVVLVTVFTRSAHIGLEVVLGNVDALHPDDLKFALATLGLNLAGIACFFKEFKIIAFDPQLASTLKIRTGFFNYFLMFLTATTVISAFRAVGVILVLSFLVVPALVARLWTFYLKNLLLYGAAVGIFCAVFGVALSRHLLTIYHLPLSTGGLVVTLLGIIFLLSLTFRVVKGLITRKT